jgi:voltage-dependent calcium channel N type alpha-1B
MDFVINAKPLELFMPTDKKSLQYKIWKLTNSYVFEFFILGLISLNTVILMLKWYDQSPVITKTLKYSNIVFTTLFSIECVLKMIALSVRVS